MFSTIGSAGVGDRFGSPVTVVLGEVDPGPQGTP